MVTSPSSTRPMSWFYNLLALGIVGGVLIFWLELPFWVILAGPVIAGIIDKLIGAQDPIDVRLQSFYLYGATAVIATAVCWISNSSGSTAFGIWGLWFIVATVFDLLIWKPRRRTVPPPRR